MLKAAIYARKSTDQSNVSEEQRSVSRQVEHARAFASQHGWSVDNSHVFSDDGISGAEFATRPGFVRLLNSVRPRAPFQVLIVSELSRLGREQLETGYALKQLSQAGIRIFSYLEEREVALDSATSKFLLSAVNFAAEMERERSRQRVTDAMVRRARAGYVTGGRAFGYQNVEIVDADGRRSHVERKVNEAEAEVIRRIFRLCAEGHGLKAIAKQLNLEGAPSPTPTRGRPKGWAPSSVRDTLHRRTYLGELRYLATRKRDSWGQRRTLRRPASDLIVVPQPAWRILSDAEWAAAHERMSRTSQTFSGTSRKGSANRQASGVASKYLLSGLGKCGKCGGSMIAHVTRDTRGEWRYYVCATYSNRGSAVCTNQLRLPMAAADEAILSQFERIVLDPQVITAAIQQAAQRIETPEDITPRLHALNTELALIEQEQQRFVAAIAVAGDVAGLAEALRDRELRRQAIRAELRQLESTAPVGPALTAAVLETELRARLTEWRRLIRNHAVEARPVLSKLIAGRLTFEPDAERRRYRFYGTATLGELLEGVVGEAEKSALPLGWCARRESNPRPTGSKPAALSS